MKSTRILRALLVCAAAVSVLHPAKSQTISLDSGSDGVKWQLFPRSEVNGDGEAVSRAGFDTTEWVDAVVPGTVFSSYVEAGLEKDPNFGDNIQRVERAKYDREFWYRAAFTIPEELDGDILWLNFRGINRRGSVWVNGRYVGATDGFHDPKAKFDVTETVDRDGGNTVAVLVDIPRGAMANTASPTYISSGGWDWMPYVPGLNSGITDKVWLSSTDALTILDPWIRTDLPNLGRADVSVEVEVANASRSRASGIIKGVIRPGDIEFSSRVNVEAGQRTKIRIDKSDFPALAIDNPRLWWPNGYGEPNLYTCEFTVEVDGKISDSQKVTFGIREYSYDTEGGDLHVSINGRRVFLKGGNWGMSEYMLRCRGEEYETKIRFHKEMNFNIIRNWLGSTTDDEFYEMCNKYGIMVWDDFWLNSNPVLPGDINAFNANAIEKIKRRRNNPCVAVWCGNNEGWPEPPLNVYLRENVRVFDGGDRYYQENSQTGNLSGSGMWGAYDPRWYFKPYPASLGGTPGWGLRTEIGTAVVPNYESFVKFMPEENHWPIDAMWNTHYFGQNAFNAAPERYTAYITERYGTPAGVEDFTLKAQLLNMESNRAMYEGWLAHMWDDASGIMTWMSQSAYPSMVWQTYDYYYDLTGAYWGVKQACVPVHILWNPVTNDVQVTNTTSENLRGLTASAEVFNTDGRSVTGLSASATLDSYSNSNARAFTIPFMGDTRDVARGLSVVASSTSHGAPADIVDGDAQTRWSSEYGNDEWIYVDLGQTTNVYGLGLNWENAYAREFRVQVSDDAREWRTVVDDGRGKLGRQDVFFDDVKARYVRLEGVRRATGYGYSLYDLKIYGGVEHRVGLTDVHFVRLTLKDAAGRIIDRNTYWRGLNRTDFTALNELPSVALKVSAKSRTQAGKTCMDICVTNPVSSKTVSFASHVQLHDPATGERILPAVYSDNYFILRPGESTDATVEFDSDLLTAGSRPAVSVVPYNNRKR